MVFKQTSFCALNCGTATGPCSQHKKAAAQKCLEASSPNSEAGSRILAKLQEQGCPHMFFYIFSHMSFPKLLKPSLISLPSIFSQFGQFLATGICAQLALASRTHFCTNSAFSDVIAVVGLPPLLPPSYACSGVPRCANEA